MAFDDEFGTPSTATGIKWSDLNGSLLLITAKSLETDITTVHGPSNAVQADVVVLDGPDAGDEYIDTLVFPKVLQSNLKSAIGTGKRVLGRLGQGEKKAGQSPPWILTAATDADKATAREVLAGRQVESAKAPF